MSKHTPGPWMIYEWAEHTMLRGLPSSVGQSDEMGMEADDVCKIKRVGDCDTEWANARLIAAAPDLLEALERIVMTQEQIAGPVLTLASRIALTAIDKATKVSDKRR